MSGEMKYDEQVEKWFALETPFDSEIDRYWGGDWGVSSEVGRLKAALMRRPGPEIDGMKDPAEWRFKALMDPDLARAQHDAVAEVYRRHGVAVHYVEATRADRPNAIYMRDNMFMTPEGAIVARQAIAARRGEEMWVAKSLAKLGVPIVRTITGHGVFEGACAMWIDRETIVLGTGNRCNREGAEQVTETLRRMGVRHFIPFHIPYGHAHVDGLMNMIDHDLALIFPWQVSHEVWSELRRRGIQVLEAPSVDEVRNMAINVVAIAPRKVLMPKGNPRTTELLMQHGAEVIEVDVDEIQKGWGSLHCMTAFLKREG
jgi:N-dimethylarginine dimethylaminohydrolase